jgi:hypothetical protein
MELQTIATIETECTQLTIRQSALTHFDFHKHVLYYYAYATIVIIPEN